MESRWARAPVSSGAQGLGHDGVPQKCAGDERAVTGLALDGGTSTPTPDRPWALGPLRFPPVGCQQSGLSTSMSPAPSLPGPACPPRRPIATELALAKTLGAESPGLDGMWCQHRTRLSRRAPRLRSWERFATRTVEMPPGSPARVTRPRLRGVGHVSRGWGSGSRCPIVTRVRRAAAS